VFGLLMVAEALLASHEATEGEISEEASKRAAEAFMIAQLKENGPRMGEKRVGSGSGARNEPQNDQVD
jgi:hypothetical protein